MPIPKVIHQIRFKGKTNTSIKSWLDISTGNDFRHKFWSDSDMKSYVRENYKNLHAYFDSISCFSFRYEVFKWLLLNKEGGIFIDTDIQLNANKIKEFTTLFNESNVIILPSKIGVHTSVLAAIPNHRVFASLIQYLESEENRKTLSKELIPLFFYQFLRKSGLSEMITRFHGAYLYYAPIIMKVKEKPSPDYKNNALFWWNWEGNKKVRFVGAIGNPGKCHAEFICHRDPTDLEVTCEVNGAGMMNFECPKGTNCSNCTSPLSCFRKYKYRVLELCLEGTKPLKVIPAEVKKEKNKINLVLIILLIIAIIVILYLLAKNLGYF